MDRFTPDDNNFKTFAQWRAGTGQDAHSFVATEAQLFANASNNNYTLSASSSAIDAGAVAGTSNQPPSTDLAGRARPQGARYDLGAYEFVQSGTPVTPPPTITPPLTNQQKVAADKTQLAADIAARFGALAADRRAIAAARVAGRLAMAHDRRAMVADRKDATKLAGDKQQLAADTLKLKNDLAQLGAVLSADVLHLNQVLQSDRLALSTDLKQLAASHRAGR